MPELNPAVGWGKTLYLEKAYNYLAVGISQLKYSMVTKLLRINDENKRINKSSRFFIYFSKTGVFDAS